MNDSVLAFLNLDSHPLRDELEALLRLLDVGRGRFSLSIAVCNTPSLRDQLIEEIRRQYSTVAVLTIPPNTIDVYGFVCDHPLGSTAAALFLIGLEASLSDSRNDHHALRSLNASRDLWPDRFPLPVIFWLPEYAARALSETARDFWRIRSHRFSFLVTEGNANGGFSAGSQNLYSRNIYLPLDEKLVRITELEQRLAQVGDPSPEMRPHVFTWMGELALLYRVLGNLNAAEKILQSQLMMAQRYDDQIETAVSMTNLGLVYLTRGELGRAEKILCQSVEINEKLGRSEGLAGNYGNLGVIYLRRRAFDNAIEMFNKALEIDTKLGRHDAIANSYCNLGLLHLERGDVEGAEEMLQRALAIHEQLGAEDGIAVDYGNLGVVFRRRGELARAEEAYRKALAISEKLGHRDEVGHQYINLGIIAERRGQFADARQWGIQARDLFVEIGIRPMVVQVQKWIDQLPTDGQR